MDSAERLGLLAGLRSVGMVGLVKSLAFGRPSRPGIATIDRPRRRRRIKPGYKAMIDRYLAEGRVRCAIDELSEVSVGAGFYTTCAEGNKEAAEAKEFVDNVLEEIDLDNFNSAISKEMWAVGGCIPWRKTTRKFKELDWVPMYTITDIVATKKGKVTALSQKLTGETEKRYEISSRKQKALLYWSYNPIDTGYLGRGLLESYVRQGAGYKWLDTSTGRWKTAYRPSLAEINEEIEDYMRIAVTRYAPRFFYTLAGFNEQEGTDLKKQLGKVGWTDDLVFWYGDKENREVTPHRLSTDPRNRLDAFIKHFTDKEGITMQTPAVKLISETGFTEASSRTAERIEMRKVADFQRKLKRLEERHIIRKILTDGDLDGTTLKLGPTQIRDFNIRIHWGEETKPELTFQELHSARALKGISQSEYRKNLTKFGIELTEEGRLELENELAEIQRKFEESNDPDKNDIKDN